MGNGFRNARRSIPLKPFTNSNYSKGLNSITLLYCLENRLSCYHMTEYGVLAIQKRCGNMGYEELTAIGIGPGISHT